MKHTRLVMLALAAGASLPVLLSYASPAKLSGRHGRTSGTVSETSMARPGHAASINGERRGPVRVVRAADASAEGYSKYGKLIPLLEEDFSKMTTGSFGNPDRTVDLTRESEYPWTNMRPEYTAVPNWGCYGAYPAGGCVYMEAVTSECHINTPYTVDASANDGIVVLEFMARAGAETGKCDYLMVESAETNNMGPSWDILGSTLVEGVTDEWSKVQIAFQGAGKTTLFNIVELGPESVYIDDLKIYTLEQYVGTPRTLPHSNYTVNGFRANWEAVDGAEGYLLSVYSLDKNSGAKIFLHEDKPVTDNWLDVESEDGNVYYYSVKSVKGEHVSLPSIPVMVFDVAAPELQRPVILGPGHYKASWSEVPGAERYNYYAYAERKAESDGPFVVTDEDFTGICDADGVTWGWTIDDPDPDALHYDDLYPPKGTRQKGWHAKIGFPYDGFICLDGWMSMFGSAYDQAGLLSPELDLGKNGGKATLSVKLAGEYCTGYMDMEGNPVSVQTQAVIGVFNWNEKLQDYEQVEKIYTTDVDERGVSDTEWREFTFNITKGTDRTIIGIFPVKAPGNLYVDDLKIVQDYKKGETFRDPFLFEHWMEGTEIEVNVPQEFRLYDTYHSVGCTRSRYDEMAQRALFAESQFCPMEFVCEGDPSGVDTFEAGEDLSLSVSAEGILRVSMPEAGRVTVYDLGGSVLCSAAGSDVEYAFPARGVYMVRAGGRTVKVVF